MPRALILLVSRLQINGQDVQNRQEAVAALSSDECTSIVLLVARPETQVRGQAANQTPPTHPPTSRNRNASSRFTSMKRYCTP